MMYVVLVCISAASDRRVGERKIIRSEGSNEAQVNFPPQSAPGRATAPQAAPQRPRRSKCVNSRGFALWSLILVSPRGFALWSFICPMP